MNALLWLALLGCPKAQIAGIDPALPEAASGIEVEDPAAILVAAAAELEPSHRGHALGFLIAGSPDPGGGPWGPRALHDPDGWVQRQGAQALLGRLPEAASLDLLLAYVQRPTADPYSRGWVGLRLRDLDAQPAQAARQATQAAWQAEPQRWRQAPLALAAWLHGDALAFEPLVGALARADLALEPDFVRDLGQSGRSELLPALREGADWVEDELALAWAAARLALGDGSGEQALRRALTGPGPAASEALDHLATLRGPEADALLKRATSQGSDRVRRTAALILAARGLQPPSTLAQAAEDPDPELRALALRFTAERLVHAGSSTPRKTARELASVLQAGLGDPSPLVRRAAVQAVAAARLPERARLLAPALQDAALETRLQAAGALLDARRTPPPP